MAHDTRASAATEASASPGPCLARRGGPRWSPATTPVWPSTRATCCSRAAPIPPATSRTCSAASTRGSFRASGSRSGARARRRRGRRPQPPASRQRAALRARRPVSSRAPTTETSSPGRASPSAPGRSPTRTAASSAGTRGFWRYAPGQRKGLGVATGRPLYALRADPRTNTVVVGPRESLARRDVRVGAGRLFVPAERVEAKLRYRSPAPTRP